jgi:hypothetical protein
MPSEASQRYNECEKCVFRRSLVRKLQTCPQTIRNKSRTHLFPSPPYFYLHTSFFVRILFGDSSVELALLPNLCLCHPLGSTLRFTITIPKTTSLRSHAQHNFLLTNHRLSQGKQKISMMRLWRSSSNRDKTQHKCFSTQAQQTYRFYNSTILFGLKCLLMTKLASLVAR